MCAGQVQILGTTRQDTDPRQSSALTGLEECLGIVRCAVLEGNAKAA